MRITKLLAAVAITGGLSGCFMMPLMHGNHRQEGTKKHDHEEKEAVCPICQKGFKVTQDTPSVTSQGKTYYFDNEEHLREFLSGNDQKKETLP